jgi:hypothetical protein
VMQGGNNRHAVLLPTHYSGKKSHSTGVWALIALINDK